MKNTSELDILIDDVVRLRSINYVRKKIFDNNLLLKYDKQYEGCVIKDIIFSYMNEKIAESELCLNVLERFNVFSSGYGFFAARKQPWVDMTIMELCEQVYKFLIHCYGEDWKDGLRDS